jgi:hypothetical protein
VRVAIVATAVLSLCFSAVAGARGTQAKLTRVQSEPLVLIGSGFVGGEHVSVVVVTGYGARKAEVTARGGRFQVTFRVPATGCGRAWAARAVGSRGSRATLTLGKRVPCIPPPMR